jgi:phosphoribosylformimino-5-aminoimidazole carboxamide ribotide isomerase
LQNVLGVLRDRTAFSLDLKSGTPLGATHQWKSGDPFSIATEAVALGVKTIIVLDLASVGAYAGTATELLCQRLHEAHPSAEVVAGGGVRGIADLARLERIGVRAALVASALHDGRLTPSDMAHFRADAS